ncbi:N-6 DNA methylase [Neisseriaceae bacterium ESL0693]|nr:N-6 DNA methylase [Neisseriaceae bacterium ESL0693]
MDKVDEYKKQMVKLLNGFSRKYFVREVFRDFIQMSGIALYNRYGCDSDLEELFNQIKRKYTQDEFKDFSSLLGLVILAIQAAKESEYIDLLGDVFMQLNLGDESKDQYFTPLSIAKILAELTATGEAIKAKIAEQSFVSVLEPTCGSGVNIITFAQKVADLGYDIERNMCVMGADIDLTCVLMCYIQCELYGIPAKILHGNSATNKYHTVWRTSAWVAYNFENKIKTKEKIKEADTDVVKEEPLVMNTEDPEPVLISSSQIDNQQKIDLLEQLALF